MRATTCSGALDFERGGTTIQDPERLGAPGDQTIDCGPGNDMAVIDLADDRTLPAANGCEEVVIVRSDRSNCSPVSRWLAGGLRKTNLLDGERYPPNANTVLARATPFPEKPALPVDEESMGPCGEYTAAHLLDPTDDPRPNVRGTDGPDVLSAILAGTLFDPLTWTPAGMPDGSSIINAGAGDDLLFGRTEDDFLRGGAGEDYPEGGRGADGLSGGEGDDRLFGGVGTDRLKGGPATMS